MSYPTLRLSTGGQMPVLGLGMWKVEPSAAPALVEEAARAGWRHFDCASDYGNETEVGAGLQKVIRSGNARREDLWITSKLWNTNHAPEHVRPACERSLSDLKLDYLDLYLIHFPIALEYVPPKTRHPAGWFYDPDAAEPRMKPVRVPISETWQAMEDLRRAGLVKNVGVSNFNIGLLRDMLAYAKTPPAVLQVEMHPYLAQEKLVRYCHLEGIAVTAFSPLGAPSYVPLGMATENDSVMNEEVIRDAAANHAKTPAQIVLRWAVQRGTAAIPKTSRPERLRENLSIFDFELSTTEMDAITSLDRNRRFNDPGVFCEQAFNTFFPIYE
ncbi:MAG TPA: aldo/keto reductase [Lacipirellulaceae bacterium]|nr:aldo/keto reductase [Lacipirellulaceae bacterium]